MENSKTKGIRMPIQGLIVKDNDEIIYLCWECATEKQGTDNPKGVYLSRCSAWEDFFKCDVCHKSL